MAGADDFMKKALEQEKYSDDPVTQVGACIVNDNQLISKGWNTMPRGCENFPWTKEKDSLEDKHLYVCHAELNAIINAVINKKFTDFSNCTMYVTLFPCNECAKLIIQVGIKKVFYKRKPELYAEKIETQASGRMFETAGVVVEQKDENVD